MNTAHARKWTATRRLRFILSIVAATAVAMFAFTAAAGATTFAVLLTGSQAGSDQDQSWAIAPTAGEAIDSMQIGLSRGYWPHFDRLTAACSSAQAQSAAGCPAGSRLASVHMVAFVGGLLPAVRSGYLANATQGKGALIGRDVLLILDQNGAYRKSISRANVGVRALDGNPEAVIDFPSVPTTFVRTNGASVSTRLQAIAILGGDAASGGKRWLRNPTSCGASAEGGGRIRLSAHYAGGRTDTITRTPSISGCGSLGMRVNAQFNPKEYTLDRSSKFDAAVDLPDPAAGRLRSDPKTVSIQIPGSIDLAGIAKLDTCSAAQLSNANCPSGSQTGTMTTFHGPPREAAHGELYFMSSTPRVAPGDAARIQLGVVLRGGGGSGGSAGMPIWIGAASIVERDFLNAGGVVIVLDGVSEMDARRLELSVDNPLYQDSGKCGTNPLYGRVGGWSGAIADTTTTFTAACAPVISLTNPADADSDGDGIADQPYRPAAFDVPFSVKDGGTGIDWSSAECSYRGWDGAIKGSTKLSDLDGDGRPDVCSVSGASEGDGTLTLRINDGKKSILGIIRRTFKVDTSPPKLTLTNPADADSDGDGIADQPYRPLSFDVAFDVSDGGSGVNALRAHCIHRGNDLPSARTTVADLDSDGRPDVCRVEAVAEGPLTLELGAVDEVGNASQMSVTFTVDASPPSIAIDESGVHITGDPDFDLFAATNVTIDGRSDPADLSDYACSILHEADLDGDGSAETISRTATRCGGAGGGAGGLLRVLPTVNKITLEVSDAAGNRSSSSIDVYLDTDAPSLSIDEPGVHITGDPDFDLLFTTDDGSIDVGGSLEASCERKGWDGTIKGSGKVITDRDTGRSKGLCSFTGVPDGTYEIAISVFDGTGHVTVLKHSFTVDTSPPSIAIDEPGVQIVSAIPPVRFDVADANPGSTVCALIDGPTGDVIGKDDDCDHFRNTKGEVCDDVGDDPDCRRTFSYPHVLETSGRYKVVITHTDAAGHTASSSVVWTVDREPPTVSLIDPTDADDDGDGVADQPFRAAAFDVDLSLADATSGIDPTKTACTLTDPQDAARSKGTVKFFNDAKGFRCIVSDSEPGDVVLTVTAVDYVGTVTIVKRGFIVDATPPTISALSAGTDGWTECRWATDPYAEDVMRVGFSIDDSSTGSGVSSAQVSFNRGPRQTVSLDGSRTDQTAEVRIDCREMTTGLDVEYRVFAQDRSGNESEAVGTVKIDASPPVLTADEPIDADGDGVPDELIRPSSFEFSLTASDVGSGLDWSTAECKAKSKGGGTVNTTKGINSPNLLCAISGAPTGELEVEASIADRSGHAMVVHRTFIVQ